MRRRTPTQSVTYCKNNSDQACDVIALYKMSDSPAIKRIRIQDLSRRMADKTLQSIARSAFESARAASSSQARENGELRRRYKRSTPLKPISIRPLPLKSHFGRESFKYSVLKQPLGNVIFHQNKTYSDAMGPKYDCPVYEFKSRRRLIYFPIVTGPKADRLYACVDCFTVYSVMTVLRNRLESIPVCRHEELGEDKDPLKFPHYCAHWEVLSKAQKLYFGEYFWQFKHDEHKLIEHAFNIGMFVKKLCSYDTKLAKFCQEGDGQDVTSLVVFIQGLDYTLKDEANALSFLECFKTLHKSEILDDKQGRIKIEGEFGSSQGSTMNMDSQSSVGSNCSQKIVKRVHTSPSVNSIHSLQDASSLNDRPSPSTPNDASSGTNSSQEESQPSLNIPASIKILESLTPGLSTLNGIDGILDSPTNQDLDLKQFITGLLMSTMTTVNNAQLQVLYDGLRPLVARHAPDCLSQFISIIHKIDRNMPSELHSVKLNTIPKTSEQPQRIITTTQQPSSQLNNTPKILRRVVTTVGSSKNPITIDGEESKKNIHKP